MIEKKREKEIKRKKMCNNYYLDFQTLDFSK